jgi:hypothetical protein
MNFEVDVYVDALKDFPSKEINLETIDGIYYHFKTDVFKGLISYSTSRDFGANVVTISVQRAKEVIAMNKKGKKPESLAGKTENKEEEKTMSADYENVVGQDSLTRFDKEKHKGGNRNRNNNRRNNNENHENNNKRNENRRNEARSDRDNKRGNNQGNDRLKVLKKPNNNNNNAQTEN